MNHPNPGHALNHQLLRLGALLQLEQRARAASRSELEFLIVNETAGIVGYQQGALWQNPAAAGAPLVLSGVAEADEGGPYCVWLTRVFAAIASSYNARESHVIDAADLPDALACEWPEWFPPHAMWCPLIWRDGVLVGSLLLGRTDPWNDGERQLLDALAGTYAQSLLLHQRVREPGFWRRLPAKRRPLVIAALLLLVIAVLPVRESVLAPAEIAPIDSAPVRAPFDGVVGALQVTPNQPVHAGQALVSLERTQLQTRYAVTQKAFDMAREDYSDTSQQAMSDDKAKARLAMLASKVDQEQAELAYDKDMLDRSQITAPSDGIAVFDDSNEWIGKPVAMGERIMMIASPARTQLQIEVPEASVVSFEPGSEVVFFSNLAPDEPRYGKLVFASYASTATAEGVMSYAFRARLDPGVTPRLGLKGTAKIYGPRRALALWLLRRPMAVVREWLSI